MNLVKKLFLLGLLLCLLACTNAEVKKEGTQESSAESIVKVDVAPPTFSLEEANKLIELPLHCVETEYPNKLGQTIGGDTDLQPPRTLHPTFYGCFDWHSAAHGYWSMVTLVKEFPELEKADEVRAILKRNLTAEKIAQEVEYFEGTLNTSYERTYGWAWLLKLSEALYTWEDPLGKELHANLEPLTQLIVHRYIEFLPKLLYPIRVGEHTNTAFGIAFAYDYAETLGHTALREAIAISALHYYDQDAQCPLAWEPSGYDFLSPCLSNSKGSSLILLE